MAKKTKKFDVEEAIKFAANCAVDWNVGDVGIKVLDLENMLYPQYEIYFRSIRPEAWSALKNKAAKKLENPESLSRDVWEHLQSIVNGAVPFGYVISKH